MSLPVDLLESLKPKFPIEVRVTLMGLFEGTYQVIGTLYEIKSHGYHTAGGGWGRYQSDPSEIPAKFLMFREKHKKKIRPINEKRVVGIETI